MKIASLQGPPRAVGSDVSWVADWLRELGIEPGQRVLVCDQNCPELVFTLLALILTDCSIVLVDDSVNRDTLHHMVKSSTPDALLAHAPTHLAPLVAPPPSAWDWFNGLVEKPQNLVLENRLSKGRDPKREDFAAVSTFASWADSLPWARREDALILFTSGSSGHPKGVVRSGTALMANIVSTKSVMGYNPDDVMLSLVPVTHQYGFSMALLAWLTGCTLALGNPSRPVESLKIISKMCDITVVDAAPSHYETLIRAQTVDDRFCASVRMWCVGGAPCPETLQQHFLQRFGKPLLDGYGMTELGNISLSTSDNSRGVGRPIPGVEVRIVDTSESGRVCSPGVQGRVLVRSEHSFHRYLDEEISQPLETWFDTEDLGLLDDDGTLHILGRIGAVHRHGHTLHLAGLESRLREHGLTAVFVATTSQHRNEKNVAGNAHLVAFVQGTEPRHLKQAVRDSLPRFAWPNVIYVLNQLPLLSNGKVDRAALSQWACGEDISDLNTKITFSG